MEPTTIAMIVTALATGAAAGTAEQAAKEAYASLKALIQRKYERVSVDMLENDPSSKERQKIVQQDLERTGADRDEEVLRQAQNLLKAIKEHAPHVAEKIGVKLEDIIVGANLNIEDIIASDTGVDAKKVTVQRDFNIKGVRAGQRQTEDFPKSQSQESR